MDLEAQDRTRKLTTPAMHKDDYGKFYNMQDLTKMTSEIQIDTRSPKTQELLFPFVPAVSRNEEQIRMTIINMLENPFKFATYAIVPEFKNRIVSENWTAILNQSLPSLKDYYRYIKADLNIRVEFTSHFQQVGLLIMYEKYNTLWENDSDDLEYLLEKQHQLIAYGQSTTYNWIIEWPINRYLDVTGCMVGTALHLKEVETMRYATGVKAQAQATVYLSFSNIQLLDYSRKD